jgi:hypothetical protein
MQKGTAAQQQPTQQLLPSALLVSLVGVGCRTVGSESLAKRSEVLSFFLLYWRFESRSKGSGFKVLIQSLRSRVPEGLGSRIQGSDVRGRICLDGAEANKGPARHRGQVVAVTEAPHRARREPKFAQAAHELAGWHADRRSGARHRQVVALHGVQFVRSRANRVTFWRLGAVRFRSCACARVSRDFQIRKAHSGVSPSLKKRHIRQFRMSPFFYFFGLDSSRERERELIPLVIFSTSAVTV